MRTMVPTPLHTPQTCRLAFEQQRYRLTVVLKTFLSERVTFRKRKWQNSTVSTGSVPCKRGLTLSLSFVGFSAYRTRIYLASVPLAPSDSYLP